MKAKVEFVSKMINIAHLNRQKAQNIKFVHENFWTVLQFRMRSSTELWVLFKLSRLTRYTMPSVLFCTTVNVSAGREIHLWVADVSFCCLRCTLKHGFLFKFSFKALISGHADALDFLFRFSTLYGKDLGHLLP